MITATKSPLDEYLSRQRAMYTEDRTLPDGTAQDSARANVDLMPRDGWILDAGCRCQSAQAVWAEAGLARTVGIDLFPRIDVHPGLLAVAGDIRRMPFPDSSFAAVNCRDTLEHVPDPDVAASEMWRVLAPGGILVVDGPVGDGGYPAHYTVFGSEDDYRGLFPEGEPVAGATAVLAIRKPGPPAGRST